MTLKYPPSFAHKPEDLPDNPTAVQVEEYATVVSGELDRMIAWMQADPAWPRDPRFMTMLHHLMEEAAWCHTWAEANEMGIPFADMMEINQTSYEIHVEKDLREQGDMADEFSDDE